MSITTALKARREQLDDREAGFTLIELLVVVIIIGILAAIAIPVYIGVQNNAKDSALKSDLTNAKTAYIAYVADKGVVPPNGISDLTNYGYASSGYTGTGALTPSIKSGNTATTFCISGKSNAGNGFNVTDSTPVAAGVC
ncbi:type II secretion system protein [uncultured Amnibacterium sp.]|uniref:type II secretion system protein n=1 Tax=uncultured Amnibacterium sp. TaxID=1631851 RepID=UPI0035C9AE5B